MINHYSLDPGQYFEKHAHRGFSTFTSPYDIPSGFSIEEREGEVVIGLRYINDLKTATHRLQVDGREVVLKIEKKSNRLREVTLPAASPAEAMRLFASVLHLHGDRVNSPTILRKVLHNRIALLA